MNEREVAETIGGLDCENKQEIAEQKVSLSGSTESAKEVWID